MNTFHKSFVLFVGFLSICSVIFAQSSTLQKVIIIRHGEKPEVGNNLSCQGLNRALHLPQVLYSKFKVPDYIYVPALKEGKSTNESRMYQTIVPFAVKYNLDIDTRYNVDDAVGLGANILKKTGVVLVVWEHNKIPDIVRALGIKEDLKWKGWDFDSILIITFENGKAQLTKDQEGLNSLSANCAP
jgi:hypothetical protein